MKTTPLTKGYEAIVDDSDFEYLNQWKWHYHVYARRWEQVNKKPISITMHRLLLEAEEGEFVDHINRNKLDNRRSNLRLCTKGGNIQNVGLRQDNTSGLKGVSWYNPSNYTPTKRWVARIYHSGKNRTIGYYHTKTEAAIAYNQEATKWFGEFAFLNYVDKLEGK